MSNPQRQCKGDDSASAGPGHSGLSKREEFAGRQMAAYMGCSYVQQMLFANQLTRQDVARLAVLDAELLIAALNKGQGDGQ